MQKPFLSSKRNVVFTAIVYTFLWGCAFPLVKLCMQSVSIADTDNMSKCLVAGIRFTLSGVMTLFWCKFFQKEKLSLNKKQLGYSLVYAALATALQYSFTYIGLSRVDGSKGAVFDQLCVFFIVLAGGMFFKEDKLNLKKIIGCIIGFFGVLIINTNALSFEFTLGGEGIMILAAIVQTAAYFVAKQSTNSISAPLLVGYGQFVGGVVLCIFSYFCGGRIHTVSLTFVITLILLAVISSVAYVLSLLPLKYFPASEISAFNLLITVFGVVMSSLLLGENIFKWNYAVSLISISFAIILINLRRKDYVESL